MAFTFDTSLYFSAANPSTAYTCGANAKLLVLDFSTEATGSGRVQTSGLPSFGNKPFTRICTSVGQGTETMMEMWALVDPSVSAAYTIVVGGDTTKVFNCHASSYNASSGGNFSIVLDSSNNATFASGTANSSLNVTCSQANSLAIAMEGNGSSTIMSSCYPGNRITPFLDKGAAQNEAQWYIISSDTSMGFVNGATPGVSVMISGVWKEVYTAPRQPYGGILKFYNSDNTWKECPSSHFQIYTGSWVLVPSDHFKIYRDDLSPADWYPIRFDGSMGTSVSQLLTGLTAYWNFDTSTSGHFIDSVSGLATTTESGILYNKAGILGKCPEYDLSTNYIVVDNSAAFINVGNKYSVSMWFKFDILPQTAGRSYVLFRIFDSVTGLDSVYIYAPSTENSVVFAVRNTTPTQFLDATDLGYLTAGEWRHLVCTTTGDASTPMKLYLNGVDRTATNTISLTGTMTKADGTLRIGNITTTGKVAVDGLIDELGVWNDRVLSATDVSTLYNNGLGLTYPFS